MYTRNSSSVIAWISNAKCYFFSVSYFPSSVAFFSLSPHFICNEATVLPLTKKNTQQQTKLTISYVRIDGFLVGMQAMAFLFFPLRMLFTSDSCVDLIVF